MEDYRLLIDLHKHAFRQGSGGDEETLRAMEMAGLDRSTRLRIANIGCGTGASTVLLARELQADIIAVDFLEDFLQLLEEKSKEFGVAGNISTLACSMESLPFKDEEFDAFLQRNGNSPEARAIVEAEESEIALYGKFKDYYSYGVYIARRVE